jgi:alpha-mannosidase
MEGGTSTFVSLRSESAIITGLKRAERGGGYVIRLWEEAGQRIRATISFPRHSLLSASLLTPIEGELGRIESKNGSVTLELAPFALVTLQCVIGR